MSRQINFNGLKLTVENDERMLFVNFESEAHKAAAYDLETKTMFILFKEKGSDMAADNRYQYLDVPVEEFIKYCKAISCGTFAVKHIYKKYKYFDEPNVF